MRPARKNALPPGTVLRGRYRIESVLGAGGFALTYLARHTGLDQKVAIKEYMPEQFAMREADRTRVRPRADTRGDYKHGLRRFAEEARTLAKFKHPGIVPVTDIFKAHGTAYMVMEYVEGESLRERIAQKGTLPEPAFRAIFDPILEALSEVHANGFLHRDIKPANIYVHADGSPVLLDFGNSREALGAKAQNLTVALTPGYAPVEQYSSHGKQGPWTDIYSLGATMYVAITGMDPPEAPDRSLDDNYVRAGDAVKGFREKYPRPLLEAIDRALAVHPESRPQDIGEFRALLEGDDAGPQTILPGRKTARSSAVGMSRAAKQPGTARVAASRSASRRLAIAASVLVLLGGGGAFGWMKYQEAEASRLAAEASRLAAEAEKAILAAAEKAQAKSERRRETARWERAAVESERRAVEAARPAARLRWTTEKPPTTEKPRKPFKKKPPRCRDVGGYEAYMKRTGKVCML